MRTNEAKEYMKTYKAAETLPSYSGKITSKGAPDMRTTAAKLYVNQ